MANLTKTLKLQTLNIFGPTPSNKWLGGKWGTMTWGYKTNAVTGANPLIRGLTKTWTKSNSSALTNTPPTRILIKFITLKAQICKLVYANSDKELFTANHYNYLFIDRVANAESAAAGNIFTSNAVASQTYTSNAVGTTKWS